MQNNKVILVLSIRSLNIGGAERQFIELARGIDKEIFDVHIITMYGGVQEEKVKNIKGIKYINLEKKGRYDFYSFLKNYKKILNEIKPHVIYSFMTEMNLFSLWCKPKKTKLIWGFRASDMDLKQYGKVSQILFWLQKKFSFKADKIIANSHAAISFHKNNSFDMSKAVVISNGIDVEKYVKNDIAREKFKARYDLKDKIAIGMVARLDYMKGYLIYTKVAKKLLDSYKNISFFALGYGDESIKKECQKILGNYNEKRFFWLKQQEILEDIYSGFDIYVSASIFGEGFSNSIAEAMSCELPCVVTDVGDSAFLVNDCGIVAKSNDIKSLTNAIEAMLKIDYKNLGLKSRQRVAKNFTIAKMAQSTQNEIEKLALEEK